MFYTIIILLNTFILYNTRKLEALNPFFLSSGLSLTIWHNSKNMVLPINCIAWVTFWNQSPQLNQLNGQMFDAQMVTIPEILTEQSVTKISLIKYSSHYLIGRVQEIWTLILGVPSSIIVFNGHRKSWDNSVFYFYWFFFFFLQLKAKFWISVPSYAAINNK